MTPNLVDDTATRSPAVLPRPGRGARWRWAAPRGALVGGGILATVLGLGAIAGTANGVAASTPSRAPAGGPPGTSGTAWTNRPGRASPGGVRPTVAGRITAVHGEDITVAIMGGPGTSRAARTATVVYSATTSFKVISSKSGTATASNSSSLKVGDFVAVRGTRHGNTITASAVVVGGGPPVTGPPRGRGAQGSG
jgi:hypothetical protein